MKVYVCSTYDTEKELKNLGITLKKVQGKLGFLLYEYGEIEINTLDELLKLQKKAKNPFIIDVDVDGDYDFGIEIYNGYRE